MTKRKISLSIRSTISVLLLGMCLCASVPAIGQLRFQKRNSDIGINMEFKINDRLIGGGAAFFDYNNDGYEDIYVTGGTGRDHLYHNNGDGSFTERGIQAGLAMTDNSVTEAVATGDIDNDGDRDIFVCTSELFRNLLFINNGDGTFTEIGDTAGIGREKAWSMSVSFGDINLDGYLDIYVGNYIENDRILYGPDGQPNGFAHECFTNNLYLNNKDNTFSEVSGLYGSDDWGCALASAFTDFDQDGDVDLLVANDFGEWVVPNKLFRNEYPAPFFSDISGSSAMDAKMYGMGIATGDCDQDGDLDYYVTNLGRNGLFMNTSEESFVDVTTQAGVEDIYSFTNSLSVGWGTAFVDFDNDTDLDLLVVNGHVPAAAFIANLEESPDKLYLNKGDFTFEDYSQEAGADDGSKGRGLAYSDYDNDGDVDYLVVPVNSVVIPTTLQPVILFENQLNSDSHWLKVDLEGTLSNRDAFGAQIMIKVGEKKWLHEIQGGNSHASQSTSMAHFGLGNANQVDSLWVYWPGGNMEVFANISADQVLEIKENPNNFVTRVDELSEFYDFIIAPNPFTHELKISYNLPTNGQVRIELFNQMGQGVSTLIDERQVAGEHTLSRNLPGIPPGVYMLSIFSNTSVRSYKLMKVH